MEKIPLYAFLDRIEREVIYSSLVACAGSIKRTSFLLGVDRRSLESRIENYKIDIEPIRKFWLEREQETIEEQTIVKEYPVTHFGKRHSLAQLKAGVVYAALKKNEWNRAHTAKDLKVCLRTVRNWVVALRKDGYEIPDNLRTGKKKKKEIV